MIAGGWGQSVFERKPAADWIRGGYLFGRRKRVKTTDWSLRSDTLGREKLLARGLDHIAIGSAGHHAILHLARGGQIVGQPNADGQQDDRDDKARDRATPAVALFRIGHSASLAGMRSGGLS